MMNVSNTSLSLQEIQRRAEINAAIASHPALAGEAARQLAAASDRVAACERALVQATTPEERQARQSELTDARIAFGRARGIPVPEDTGLRYTGAALMFVGGSDVTKSEWFQRQVDEQQRHIPKSPTLQQQLENKPPSGPPPGSLVVGDNWVRNWGQR